MITILSTIHPNSHPTFCLTASVLLIHLSISSLIDAVLAESSYFGAPDLSMPIIDKKVIKILSSTRRKVELVATHICKVLPNMVLKILTIQDSSTAWTVRIVFLLCKSTILMPRTKLLCLFGVQWFILNTQKVLILLKLKFSDELELFRSCLLGKRAVQGVVKRTKENIQNSRETHTSLAF